MKHLTRSNTDRMIAGVCGGLGEYFQTDATLIRLIFVFILIFTGLFPGLLFYIIAALIIPKDTELSRDAKEKSTHHEESTTNDSE